MPSHHYPELHELVCSVTSVLSLCRFGSTVCISAPDAVQQIAEQAVFWKKPPIGNASCNPW